MQSSLLSAIEHYCAYQERCHSEVRNKLFELGARGEDIEESIAHLIENNFLNEERFAKAYARGKAHLKKWGRNKIIHQLRMKKVSEYCIKKGILDIDEEVYNKHLQSLISQKKKDYSKHRNPAVIQQKIINFLLRNGYEFDIIKEELKR